MPRFPTSTDEASETTVLPPDPERFALVSAESPSPLAEATGVAPALPCANCGTPLAGPYCGQCGQHVADYHRSLWRFIQDFLDNSFCWDNKFLRTVEPLVRQPGFLTQEFMAGRRVRYVHPLRLFLFTSAVSLALIGFIKHHEKGLKPSRHARHAATSKSHPAPVSQKEKDADAEADDADKPATLIPPQSVTPIAPSPATVQPETAPAHEASFSEKIQQVLAASAAKSAAASPAASPASSPTAAVPPQAAPAATPAADEDKNPLAEAHRVLRENHLLSSHKPKAGSAAANVGVDESAIEEQINQALEKGDKALESAEKIRAQKIGKMVMAGGGSEQMARIAAGASENFEQKFSWAALALLPVFALLMRTVYWRRDGYYFEQFVFSLHYHTFLLLFWAAYACAGVLAAFMPLSGLWNFLLGMCLLLPGRYLFLALRRFYDDGPRLTVFKVCVLGALHILSILVVVAVVEALFF